MFPVLKHGNKKPISSRKTVLKLHSYSFWCLSEAVRVPNGAGDAHQRRVFVSLPAPAGRADTFTVRHENHLIQPPRGRDGVES